MPDQINNSAPKVKSRIITDSPSRDEVLLKPSQVAKMLRITTGTLANQRCCDRGPRYRRFANGLDPLPGLGDFRLDDGRRTSGRGLRGGQNDSPHQAQCRQVARGARAPLFPLTRRTKRPAVSGWQEAATTDEATLEKWFGKNDRYNIGVFTGRDLIVIDADVKGVDNGDENIRGLPASTSPISTTP